MFKKAAPRYQSFPVRLVKDFRLGVLKHLRHSAHTAIKKRCKIAAAPTRQQAHSGSSVLAERGTTICATFWPHACTETAAIRQSEKAYRS